MQQDCKSASGNPWTSCFVWAAERKPVKISFETNQARSTRRFDCFSAWFTTLFFFFLLLPPKQIMIIIHNPNGCQLIFCQLIGVWGKWTRLERKRARTHSRARRATAPRILISGFCRERKWWRGGGFLRPTNRRRPTSGGAELNAGAADGGGSRRAAGGRKSMTPDMKVAFWGGSCFVSVQRHQGLIFSSVLKPFAVRLFLIWKDKKRKTRAEYD